MMMRRKRVREKEGKKKGKSSHARSALVVAMLP